MTARGRCPGIFFAMLSGCVLLSAVAGPGRARAAPPPELATAKAAVGIERWADAESLATVALATLEKSPAPDSLAIADALEYAGTAHWRRSGYADGIGLRLANRSLGIRQRRLPPNDLRVANAHALVARFLPETGRPDSAVAHVRRALAIRSAQPAPDDTLLAKTWDQLALIQRNSGDMRSALDSWTHAIELRKRAHGPEHPEVARLLAQTGVPWMELGDLDHARAVLEESLLMFARTDPNDPRRWIPLNILADVEKRSGNLTLNIDLLQEALRIVRAAYGENSREALTLRTNLAIGLSEFDDDAGCAAINRELLPLVRAQYGASHLRTIVVQHGLALSSLGTGDYDTAETLLRETEHTLSGLEGPPSYILSRIRAQYSDLLYREGRDAEARVMADSALSAALAMREPDFTALCTGYSAQIIALSESGDTAAIARARRGLADVVARYDVTSKLVGPKALYDLSRAATVLGEPDEAWRLALDAERRAREIVQVNLSALSDRHALLFTRDEGRFIQLVAELARRSGDPGQRAIAFDRLLRNRGTVRAEMARRRLPAGSDADTALVALHERWIAAQGEWSRRIVRYGGAPRDSAQRAVLQRLRATADQSESDYASALATRGSSPPMATVGWSDVRARLGAGQALVSCARAVEGNCWRVGRDTSNVVAFVARGGSEQIEFVDLGRSIDLEAAIEPWLARLAVSPGSDAKKGDPSERELRRLGAAVRAATWDKIAPAIRGATDVYVAGDGSLVDLPWQALPEGKDRYLVEAGPRIHVLGAERELVDPHGTPVANSLLALGAPDFDRGATNDAPATIQVAALVRSAPDPCANAQAARFAPLPASGDEAEAAARSWRALPGHDAVVLTGAAASEAAFKSAAHGHAVLHLATHGFVTGDRCLGDNAAGADGMRGVGGLGPVAATTTHPATGANAATATHAAATKPAPAPGKAAASGASTGESSHVSPWISRRVWLALAGANRASEHEGDDNEGLLTAEEVVTLDLAGTDWVVLSACHSGVADWTRDGALGMRRAFDLAGARTVISSQWAVEDASTVEWMKALYAARESGATSGAAAVESASRTVLAARRKDGRTTHPFYWAAFGASGE